MAFTAFSGLTGTIANLNAYLTQLFLLRELISDPGYVAAVPRINIDGGGNVGFGGAPAQRLHVIGTARFDSSGVWAQYGATTTAASFCTFHKGATSFATVVGYIGTDGGAIETAGTGSHFGLRSDTDLLLMAGGGMGIRVLTSRHVEAGSDNTQTLGTATKRWSTVYAGTGTINTSDAREKTALLPLNPAEIEAAKRLAREVGSFQFLSAIASKDRGARLHIGMTVQRAMQIMTEQGLDPRRYAFICHDQWSAQTLQHAVVTHAHESLVDKHGQPIQVEVEPAWTETIPAGDRYGFRADELLLFIARGFEARLAALEAAA